MTAALPPPWHLLEGFHFWMDDRVHALMLSRERRSPYSIEIVVWGGPQGPVPISTPLPPARFKPDEFAVHGNGSNEATNRVLQHLAIMKVFIPPLSHELQISGGSGGMTRVSRLRTCNRPGHTESVISPIEITEMILNERARCAVECLVCQRSWVRDYLKEWDVHAVANTEKILRGESSRYPIHAYGDDAQQWVEQARL